MGLESATYLSDLVSANPASSDAVSAGDDHIRGIKSAIKTTFPNISGAVTPTHAELNHVDGVTSAIQTQLDAKGAHAGQTWTGTHGWSGATMQSPALGNTAITAVKFVGLNGIYDNGNSGTAKTVTLANGQSQKLTLTGNLTLTISFTGASAGIYRLRLIQDATGGRTLANISGLSTSRWIGSASQPSHNTAANGETLIVIEYDGSSTAIQSMTKIGAV